MRVTERLLRLARRVLQPRRTIWPTRDGWWSLFVVIGLGVAAINTGNNLLYLLVSLLLGLIIVSGMLSEFAMRGIELTALEPEEVYAGRPTVFGARVANRKRWLTSYSITLDLLSAPIRARCTCCGSGPAPSAWSRGRRRCRAAAGTAWPGSGSRRAFPSGCSPRRAGRRSTAT
jgi:hypothetical protein